MTYNQLLMAFEFVVQQRVKRHTFPSAFSSRRFVTFLLFCMVILPAISAFAILQYRSLPVPYQDDYNAILNFAISYDQLPTLTAKVLQIATAQHNEYKLGFEHLILASELSLTHHISFAFLTNLGNLFLLPIGYLLWKTYQGDEERLDRRLLYFLPISLVFFSLTYWETLNWAMTCLQQVPVVFFSLLTIFLLVEKQAPQVSSSRFGVACLVAMLACTCSANAFLLLPVGLLILVPRHLYLRCVVWAASFMPPLGAYLYHYKSLPQHAHQHAYLSRPLEFIALFGGVVPSRWIAALAGFAILMVFLLAVRSRFYQVNPVSFYSTVWIMGTALMVAWVRGADGFGNPSRYTMYSLLMLIFCYAFFSHYFSQDALSLKRVYSISLALSVVIFVGGSFQANRKLEARRQMVYSGLEFYRSNPAVNSPMIDPLVELLFKEERPLEKKALTEAIQAGVYTLPPEPMAH
jgi:hypothetical protein